MKTGKYISVLALFILKIPGYFNLFYAAYYRMNAQKKFNFKTSCFLFLLYLVFSSCSGTRKLPEGESLYTGAMIKINSTVKIKNKGAIKKEAKSALVPRPNKTILGMRPKLCIYNAAGTSKKNKGFRHWLKTKVGEAPVLISQVNPGQVSKVIDARLFNMGIFNSLTTFNEEKHKHKTKITYTLNVHQPYKISRISFSGNQRPVDSIIQVIQPNSILKTGQDYSLSILKKERERIDDYLKNYGYYYFKPDYLIFRADSSIDNKTITLQMAIKPDVPAKAIVPYLLKDIYIETDFSLSKSDSLPKDTIPDYGTYFIERHSIIHHSTISRSVFLKKAELYSKKNHNMTLSRLMSMGNFKFVNIRFTETDTATPGYLNAYIYITPTLKRTVRFEFNAITKSNNFTGPALNINFKNRNSLNGAELLSLNLRASFETQFTGVNKGLFSYEIGPQVDFYVPHFILPFRIREPKNYYIPKTRFSLSYNYLKRVQYYNLTALQFVFGYKWKENIKKDHELNPVNINYIAVTQKSDEFQKLLDDNFLLKKSFEEQFIAGLNYVFTYNEQVIQTQKNQFFLNFSADLAGNTITLAKTIFTKRHTESNDPFLLAGKPYSQFARGTIDIRNYFNVTQKSKFVVRFYSGIGVAYGNSASLPYVKQFFSGGPNSIRAFRINSLGPGDYKAPDSLNTFLEQGGDFKLEGNIEFRFPIINFLKGAFFADAGNIWLRKPNGDTKAKAFAFKSFYKEVGAGIGLGLRIDVTFFVLRLDLAIPVRKPWLPENERWVINKISFGDPSWRSENPVLNIAIGYPF